MDISIIVPIYNVEEYLSCCLDSILNQKFDGDYEVICVNDGSTDNSLEIIKHYIANHSNIILINQENKGLSGARNSGMKASKGRYILCIDSDDYFKDQTTLNTMYKEAIKNDLDIVIADFEYNFEDKDKNYRLNRCDDIKNKILSGRSFFEDGIKTKSISSVVWNKIYKREFIEKNDLYFIEGILHEDMEYTPRVLYRAQKVKYIDEVLIAYRQRQGSIMSSKSKRNKTKDYTIIIKHLMHVNEEFNTQALNNQIAYVCIKLLEELKEVKDKKIINDTINKLVLTKNIFNTKTKKIYLVRILINLFIIKFKRIV